MELRYLLVSVIIIVTTFIFSVYGVMTRDGRVIGVALSFMILGITFLVLGATYSRPFEELLRQYSSDLSIFTTKIIEDMGIISSNRTKLCLSSSLVVFSEKLTSCSNITAGVGIQNDIFYIAIPTTNFIQALSKIIEEESSLANAVKKFVIDMGSLCRFLSVTVEGNTITIEMNELTALARELIGHPLNIVRLGIIAIIAIHLKADVEVVEEIVTINSYKLKARVEGSRYG